MKQRTLPGIDTADEDHSGRTDAHLGPSDSSDSASDLAGQGGLDDADPNVPVDVALRDDGRRSLDPAEAVSGAASDAAGTGESRSAGADAGLEAADVGVDRVFTLGEQEDDGVDDTANTDDTDDTDESEDPDLAFLDSPDLADAKPGRRPGSPNRS